MCDVLVDVSDSEPKLVAYFQMFESHVICKKQSHKCLETHHIINLFTCVHIAWLHENEVYHEACLHVTTAYILDRTACGLDRTYLAYHHGSLIEIGLACDHHSFVPCFPFVARYKTFNKKTVSCLCVFLEVELWGQVETKQGKLTSWCWFKRLEKWREKAIKGLLSSLSFTWIKQDNCKLLLGLFNIKVNNKGSCFRILTDFMSKLTFLISTTCMVMQVAEI